MMSALFPIDRRLATADGLTLPDRTQGAALFADISGFTLLTNTLVQELGRKQGAEALLDYINPVYEALIMALHNYSGSVIGFSGDAITCWFDEQFPDPSLPAAARRAVACALAMQTIMASFAIRHTPQGTAVPLSIKIAIAAGPARRFLLGVAYSNQHDVLAGATLTRMVAAEKQAQAGEIVVSPEVEVQLTDDLDLHGWREGVALVANLRPLLLPTPWPKLPNESQADRQTTGHVHANGLRSITCLMLRFGGLDFDQDDAAGPKLDSYIRWVESVLGRYEGTLIQLTLGDKGAYFCVAFGVPVAHEDDNRRAMTAGLARVKLAQGDWKGAQEYGQQVMAHLPDNPYLDREEDPMLTFRLMWEVWVGLGQMDKAQHILTLAVEAMQQYLDTISDDTAAQAMYLGQPHHKLLWQAWQDRTTVIP